MYKPRNNRVKKGMNALFYLDIELVKELHTYAISENKSKSLIVTNAIKEWLNKHKESANVL